MNVENSSVGQIADDLFRHEGARIVAMLANHFGVQRQQLAEDVVQEALVRALQTWPYRGVPENPAAWLMQTAKNLALDTLRREQSWQEKEGGIALAHERWLAAPASAENNDGTFTDDTLRMMFEGVAKSPLTLQRCCPRGSGEKSSTLATACP